MKLYIQIDDQDELETAAVKAIRAEIATWLEATESMATPIGATEMAADGDEGEGEMQSPLGIHLQVKRRAHLKAPFSFLYPLAKKHKSEFVVGIIDEKSGDQEEVCYFGFEEGKPDVYEISNYLGL